MELKKRTVELANFNCVFGDENEPLLAHFSDVLLPAFKSGHKINYSNSYFTFEDITITYDNDLGYIFTGTFIRQTKLQIYTQTDPKTGKLINTNKEIPSSPFSIFVILLKNHRMLFFKNQNGSPRLSTFKTISEKMIRQFLREQNKNAEYNSKLPGPHISIIPLPSHESLKEQFKLLKKIHYISYKLTPVNGDNDYSTPLQGILKQVKTLKGKNADVKINAPENKDKVIEHVEQTKDLAYATIDATSLDGNKVTLKHDNFTKKYNIDLPLNFNINTIVKSICNIAKSNSSLQEVSIENKRIYKLAEDMLKSLLG